MYPGTSERVQTSHQIGTIAQAHRGVRRHPQGGLCPPEDQPAKDSKTGYQKMVLYSFQRIRTSTKNHNQKTDYKEARIRRQFWKQ